jgi:hypothetical protein
MQRADVQQHVVDLMSVLERTVDGFRSVEVRHDGDRLGTAFKWFEDPNTYEIWSALSGGPWPWEDIDWVDLEEELETGFLLRASKSRRGPVLRIEFDAGRGYELDDRSFYLSKVLDYVGHLVRDGLDTGPGLAARKAATILGWTAAYVNSAMGGPTLAQIVTIRDSDHEAHIAQLQLLDHADLLVGQELVFYAIHQAARHGVHRLYSPRSLSCTAPFGFTATPDRPDMAVYDITSRDLNWPGRATSDIDT